MSSHRVPNRQHSVKGHTCFVCALNCRSMNSYGHTLSAMMRTAKIAVGVLVLALAVACSSGDPVAAPSPSTTPSAVSTPTPTPVATPASAPVTPAGDAVPLTKFPILASPCKYLRKVDLIEAMGTQKWRASERKLTPKTAGWAEFAVFPEIADVATSGSECAALVNSKRALFVKVFAFNTVAEASKSLAPNQKWPGLGDQADLGSVARGGSGFMRVGRVVVHLVVLYDNLARTDARLVVQDILKDLLQGLPK